jgi:hypothetical protein
MRRPKRDPAREDRIHNEAIVDARPEEQAMSWYYYLEGKISFLFRAKCLAANAVSPLRKGKPSRSYRWPWRISASTTYLCRSVGKAARWQSLSRN